MLRRSNPWPSVVDLFSALLMVAFGGLMLMSGAERELQRRIREIQDLQEKNRELHQTKKKLEEEVLKLRELRSRDQPSCMEKGLASGPLFVATIRGRNQYELPNGRLTSLEGILSENAQALALATRNSCRHRADVFYGLGVSGVEYDEALRRIRGSFRISMKGPHQ